MILIQIIKNYAGDSSNWFRARRRRNRKNDYTSGLGRRQMK
jgi:hypothetical protein